MNSALAIISVLISSIALTGVALSLLFQARQLRTSQLQAARQLQVQILQLEISKPDLAGSLQPNFNQDDYPKAVFLNQFMKYIEMSYLIGAISRESVRMEAAQRFKLDFPRIWWSTIRHIYEEEAVTKREKEFFKLVDMEFQEAMRLHEAAPG
jgi:hypothetical protein